MEVRRFPNKQTKTPDRSDTTKWFIELFFFLPCSLPLKWSNHFIKKKVRKISIFYSIKSLYFTLYGTICSSSKILTYKKRDVTLGTHWFRHGTRVTQALCVDGTHHEQVDGIGSEAFNGELGGFNVIRNRLPAVTHRLAEGCRKKKSISQMGKTPIKT